MRLLPSILTFLVALAPSCATTKTARERCEEDARTQYQQCQNPIFIPQGEPPPTPTGEKSQDCRGAYRQALMTCDGGGQEVPLVPIGTSSVAPTAN
jgi:hypothetical protein